MDANFFLWLLFGTIYCSGSEIPGYVTRLIRNIKENELFQVHDVVILTLGTENKELTKTIATSVAVNNVLLMPQTGLVLENQRIRAASVLIIVSDIVEEVQIKFEY